MELPSWIESLAESLGLYFVLFLLGYVLVAMVKKNPSLAHDHGWLGSLARFFVFGNEEYTEVSNDEENVAVVKPDVLPLELSLGMKALLLSFCVSGLLGSYLLWGVLQERIMTTTYESGRFGSSTFLVFCNRILALAVACCVVQFTNQPFFRPPFYMFSFTSLSNVLSSFCQLEALKFVSFPTQVLFKSSKMIPVMLMGKAISLLGGGKTKSYPWYDYGVAVAMALGISVFVLNQDGKDATDTSTSLSGIVLIIGYLVFDSFTSQWQGHLFSTYKLSSYQMMLGVNAFSAFFTLASLLASGELWSSIDFLLGDSKFLMDVLVFSISGALGQSFIFFTISRFGAVTFTLIMACRQLVSVILSVIIFGHSISEGSVGGAFVVFAAVGYRIYRQQTDKKKNKTSVSIPIETEMVKT